MKLKNRNEIQNKIQPIIAAELLRYRVKNGLSQEKMARELKISVRSYIELEHGRALTSATTLAFFLTMLSEDTVRHFLEALRRAIDY